MPNRFSATATGNEQPNIWFTLLKGYLISIVLSIILFAIASFVMLFTTVPQSAIRYICIAVSLISILIGGWTAGKSLKNRGWLWGAIIGVFYFLVLFICSCIAASSFTFSAMTVSMILFGFVAGALGGIIGVNLQSGKKKRR